MPKTIKPEATHYTAFADAHGGYHAGDYTAEEPPTDTAFLIGEGPQADVDEKFALITGTTAVGGSSVSESLRDGARASDGQYEVVSDDWGILNHAKTSTGSRFNGGRKPVDKK